MKQPKYKIGDFIKVSENRIGTIKAIEEHGSGKCDCCPYAELYFMYNWGGNGWLNEDYVEKVLVN